MSFSPPVVCWLLKKSSQKWEGGSQAPQEPPGYTLGLSGVSEMQSLNVCSVELLGRVMCDNWWLSQSFWAELPHNLTWLLLVTHVEKRESDSKYSKKKRSFGKRKLILQNAMLRITRSSHSLSTTYLRLLHSGRLMGRLFKPSERLKLSLVIRNSDRPMLLTSDDPGSWPKLACVKLK